MATRRVDSAAWLLRVAKLLAKDLAAHAKSTPLRPRVPRVAGSTNTGGWYARLGRLYRGGPSIELWYDRFSGYPDRRFFVCLRSESRAPMVRLTKRLSKRLWPVRNVEQDDIGDDDHLVLTERLKGSELQRPILERYAEGRTFFGIYDNIRGHSPGAILAFVDRASAFYLDVAAHIPGERNATADLENYAAVENRLFVALHLARERSRYLAAQCKIRDDHTCQICDMRFADVYGKKLGAAFCEAHHIVPLSKLRPNTRTEVDDLITVCPNCHRMLHRMSGAARDISALRRLVLRQRRA